MRLILIEDNTRLASLVCEGLGRHGFAIDCYETVEDAKAALTNHQFDLVLLDLGLPDGDGLSIIKTMRTRDDKTPILVLTARSDLDDRVLGLDAGADDYLVKPFQLLELAARCRAILRRPSDALGTILDAGNVTLNPAERTVSVDGQVLEVAPREIDLLERLMRRIGHVVPKPVLENAMYSMDSEVTPNALEASVSRLRKQLTSAVATVQLKTIHGVGYALFESESSQS